MTDTVFNPLAKKGLDAVRSLATLDTHYLKLDCSNDPLTGTFITRKIKPVADDTYDLGQFAPNFRWRNLALSGSFYSKAGYISGETSIIGLNITNIEEVNARARIYFTNSLGDNASIFFTSACQDVLNPCQLYIDGNGAVNFGSDNIITTGSITQDGITLDSTYLKLDATNYSSVIFPDATYIGIDQIRARDAGGLKLYDDGGSGIFIKNGGFVGFNEVNYDLALLFLNNFFNLYVDPTLTSHEVCSQFFEWGAYDECVMRREQEMMDGIQLEGFDLITDGYGFSIDLYYVDSELNHFTKHMNAYFYYNEYGALRLDLFEDFGLIPYEVAYSHLQQLIGEFNNYTLTSENVCNLFFGAESVFGCIEKREELMMNNVTIQLWMIDVEYDHYRVELEYNDGYGNYWYETVQAYFYYDEFGNLKVDFKGEGPEEFPYEEAYNYVAQMLYDFGDPNMPTGEFCAKYGLDNTNCIWDRALLESINQLEHVELYIDYFDYQDYVFKTQIMFNNHYTGEMWYEVVFLEFGYDEYGNIFMHMYDAPVNNYLNYTDSYNLVQQFFWDYMNQGISFNDLNAWYFDYQMGYDFEIERLETFNTGRNYVLLQVNDPYGADGQEFLEIIYDVYEYGTYTETLTIWVRVMPLANGYHYLEFWEDQQEEYIYLDYNEAHAFMTSFINDYSDHSLSSYEVCSFYFGEDEAPMCMVKRDAEIMEGITVLMHALDEMADGFYADFGYYTATGEFIYSEYTQIFFFVTEKGELKLTFDCYNYQKSFPYDEAMQYIETYLRMQQLLQQ